MLVMKQSVISMFYIPASVALLRESKYPFKARMWNIWKKNCLYLQGRFTVKFLPKTLDHNVNNETTENISFLHVFSLSSHIISGGMFQDMHFLTSSVDFDVSPVDVSICDRSALTRGDSRRLSLSLSLKPICAPAHKFCCNSDRGKCRGEGAL